MPTCIIKQRHDTSRVWEQSKTKITGLLAQADYNKHAHTMANKLKNAEGENIDPTQLQAPSWLPIPLYFCLNFPPLPSGSSHYFIYVYTFFFFFFLKHQHFPLVPFVYIYVLVLSSLGPHEQNSPFDRALLRNWSWQSSLWFINSLFVFVYRASSLCMEYKSLPKKYVHASIASECLNQLRDINTSIY